MVSPQDIFGCTVTIGDVLLHLPIASTPHSTYKHGSLHSPHKFQVPPRFVQLASDMDILLAFSTWRVGDDGLWWWQILIQFHEIVSGLTQIISEMPQDSVKALDTNAIEMPLLVSELYRKTGSFASLSCAPIWPIVWSVCGNLYGSPNHPYFSNLKCLFSKNNKIQIFICLHHIFVLSNFMTPWARPVHWVTPLQDTSLYTLCCHVMWNS